MLNRVLGDHGPDSAAPDRIDWTAKRGGGDDCISGAALNGNLCRFWNLVKARNVRYFTAYAGKIPINQVVKRADYDRLSAEDKKRFDLKKGIERR